MFDLDQENWASTMSDKQLSQIKWRIKVKDAEIKEMHGNPKKHQFTKYEIQLLQNYVDEELTERNSIQRPAVK